MPRGGTLRTERHPWREVALGWAAAGLLAGASVTGADDAELEAGRASSRYPEYTFDDELPTETAVVPGASSGVFYERHQFGRELLGRWRADYLNYGWRDYENYRLNTTPYSRSYDVFGNYIAEGYEIYTLEEWRTRTPLLGSLQTKGRFFENWLRHLVIADDAYGEWSTRLMVGDHIRTTFTPLTLDMASFNGIRFDAISSRDQQLTLLVSRVSDPIRLSGSSLTGRGTRSNLSDGVYLVGGHWESNLSDALVLGASYVNLYRFDSQRGFRANSRKGLAPQNTVPQQVIVRFEDDSPDDDGRGAVIYDLSARVTLATSSSDSAEGRSVVEMAPSAVTLSSGSLQTARYSEATGIYRDDSGIAQSNYVDYTFDVPEDAVQIVFSGLVANDYKISVRQSHRYITDAVRGSFEKRETEFTVIRRAEGNVTDLSNLGVVTFEYGMTTGVEVLGVNGRLKVPGLDGRGELVRSINYYQYPTMLGTRSSFDDVAGYLVLRREWSRFSVGGEAFSVGPRFTSYNPHPSDANRPLGEVFYFNESRETLYRNAGTVTNNPLFALVDDNDNMLYNETPDNWLVLGLPAEGAIFPCFDLDKDGHPDTNRNRNQYADSEEPFLMYWADPEDLYFGDDLNNNSLTDAWEDDELPNYPYYKDERGLHLLAGLNPMPGVTLTAGRYRVRQMAAAGHNRVSYGHLDVGRTFAGNLRCRWRHETKDVEDDIPNDYYRYLLRETVGGYTRTYFADALDYRNSQVNRGLVEARYRPFGRWMIEGKFRYELNHQRQDGIQDDDHIDYFGGVLRGEYSWRWRTLTFIPKAKILFRTRSRDSQSDPTLKALQAYPILRVDWRLTRHSQLRLGLQGLPWLTDRRRDWVDPGNDSEQSTWTFMWFSETEYEGYRIGTEIGIMRQRTDYDASARKDVDYDRFFVRVNSAVGSVVR